MRLPAVEGVYAWLSGLLCGANPVIARARGTTAMTSVQDAFKQACTPEPP
jgi:hypothetical protein